ncbi:hypothetical protein L2E82_53861 [Cichorium intybus]|nr:hypothetical protein L2E82_53861 [Cichorium intybus]
MSGDDWSDGNSNEEFEEIFRDSIIRDSSPEIEANIDTRDAFIELLNGEKRSEKSGFINLNGEEAELDPDNTVLLGESKERSSPTITASPIEKNYGPNHYLEDSATKEKHSHVVGALVHRDNNQTDECLSDNQQLNTPTLKEQKSMDNNPKNSRSGEGKFEGLSEKMRILLSRETTVEKKLKLIEEAEIEKKGDEA